MYLMMLGHKIDKNYLRTVVLKYAILFFQILQRHNNAVDLHATSGIIIGIAIR